MAATQPPVGAASQAPTAPAANNGQDAETALPAASATATTQTAAAVQPRGLAMFAVCCPLPEKTCVPKVRNHVNAEKYTSRMLLQRVYAVDQVADVKDFTIAIVKLYNGKGLHPLSAIKKLATFPDYFDIAVEQLFVAFTKVSNPANHEDHVKYWKAIRKPQGAVGRYIKGFDRALTWMISTHWFHLLKEGRDLDWLPMHLDSRIRQVWGALLGASSPPQQYGDVLARTDPTIFSTSLDLLKFCQTRCAIGIKVMRVAGHRLPPELVNMIKDMAIGHGEFSRVVKLALDPKAKKNTRILILPAIPPPPWFNAVRGSLPDGTTWEMFLSLYPRIGV